MRYVYAADGNVAATVDSAGRVSLGLEPGPIIGLVQGDSDVYADEAGAEWLGRVDPDGRVIDREHDAVGRVDTSGRIFDRTGRLLGKGDRAVDAAVLLLVVGNVAPHAIAPLEPPADSMTTMMDDAIALADEAKPGIRKNYTPLTDEDVYGTPKSKKTPKP